MSTTIYLQKTHTLHSSAGLPFGVGVGLGVAFVLLGVGFLVAAGVVVGGAFFVVVGTLVGFTGLECASMLEGSKSNRFQAVLRYTRMESCGEVS
jgi:hypothetical protein